MSKALIIIHRPRSPQFGAFLFPPTQNYNNPFIVFFRSA
nr:MAG TPA: hypothetical protein [Caudoviricetes sp.]